MSHSIYICIYRDVYITDAMGQRRNKQVYTSVFTAMTIDAYQYEVILKFKLHFYFRIERGTTILEWHGAFSDLVYLIV